MNTELDVDQIGPFKVTGVLGGGAMGKVYSAVQPSVNRVIALKVLPKEMERNSDAVRRFALEAETAANLNHTNIVRVWDASIDEPPYYIALQYLGGGTLEDRIRGQRLSVEEAIRLAVPMLHALDYAHRQRIVHRDIKPANIMFDEKDIPYLTDFGIAKAADKASMTAHGATFGTPNYMSPEQAKGRPMDCRSDLFSMAVVIYEMLAGRPPFLNNDSLVTMSQIVNDELPLFSELGVDVPSSVESVLRYALHKDPAQRYQSGAEFAAALQEALASGRVILPEAGEPVTGPEPHPKHGHFSLLLRAILAVVMVAIIGVCATIFWPKNQRPIPSASAISVKPSPVSAGGGQVTVLVSKSRLSNPAGMKVVFVDKYDTALVSTPLTEDTSGNIVSSVFVPANTLGQSQLLRAKVLSAEGKEVPNLQTTVQQKGNTDKDEAKDLVEPAKERIREVHDKLMDIRGQSLTPTELKRIRDVLIGKCSDAVSKGQRASNVAPGYRDAYWVQIQGFTYIGTISKDPAKLRKAREIAKDALRRFPQDKEIQDAVDILGSMLP